jgi:CRP-like cAMP-binding protein
MFAIENWWTADLGSFISQSPADYNVQCLEDSLLAQIAYPDLEQLYLDVPRLERFFRIIIQKAFVASQRRVVGNFSLSAKDRYLKFKEQYPRIEQRVPQYLIASYLGITREFLSKIRSQLITEQ